MSRLLFLDESGHDRTDSPYEVLAGVCIDDREIWNLINQIHQAEESYFGQRITAGVLELKAKKLLKRKTYRLAAQFSPFAPEERTRLARSSIERRGFSYDNPNRNITVKREVTALAQAKIAFVRKLLELCIQFRVKAFASIIDKDAPRSQSNFLRKDYSFLLERLFRFLENCRVEEMGIVVFDELEKTQSHLLVDQMYRYFRETATGMHRASRIIPEPFFVHSDLTTGIQLADLVAYIISWGLRVHTMTRPRREELSELAELVKQLRYTCAVTGEDERQYAMHSFAVIGDLRPREEREGTQ